MTARGDSGIITRPSRHSVAQTVETLTAVLRAKGVTLFAPVQGPAQSMNVHSTQITATTCSQDRTTASIYGNATIDGAGSHFFRIDVTDAGSGGSNDTYGIRLDTGYMSGQHRLGGGNITIH